jgi:hypothetical protein
MVRHVMPYMITPVRAVNLYAPLELHLNLFLSYEPREPQPKVLRGLCHVQGFIIFVIIITLHFVLSLLVCLPLISQVMTMLGVPAARSYSGYVLAVSQDSDWLRTGRTMHRGSSPGRVKNFLFSTSSRPALRPTQPPIQCVPGFLPRG